MNHAFGVFDGNAHHNKSQEPMQLDPGRPDGRMIVADATTIAVSLVKSLS